jgi:tRNA pseudouridine38-40 synthase
MSVPQRYFIQLRYKGTNFNGWQKQKNAKSIQETIENALSILLRASIELTGAGRTDTGVHAQNYFAHFDSPISINEKDKFIYQVNQIVNDDICITRIINVIPKAHARFDAISRTYEYRIILDKDPFEREFCTCVHHNLDLLLMNECCTILLENKDFTSFCKLHSNNKTNVCNLIEAKWFVEGKKMIFKIKSDRFLRNMVRAIVGTMIKVGEGKLSIEEFKIIVASRNRQSAGNSAPPQGLHLIDIEYPQHIFLLDQ